MTVSEYGIGTFLVSSESGQPDYLVDLAWREEAWLKPKPLCGCWRSFCHGELCKHIEAVVRYEQTPQAHPSHI